MKRILATFALLISFLGGYAQIDTEFWFAAPEVINYTLNAQGLSTNGHADRPVSVFVSSLASAATVTIEVPADPSFTPIVLNLAANDFASHVFSDAELAILENTTYDLGGSSATWVRNKGMHITSTAPITVYYEVLGTRQECTASQWGGNGGSCWWPEPGMGPQVINTDIFALKGSNALGNEFYVNFQNHLNNTHNHVWCDNPPSIDAWSSFDIVATEDNTLITIELPTGVGSASRAAGSSWTVTLNRGQTYSVRAQGNLAGQHMAGAHVTSDKPVAITMKDDSIYHLPEYWSAAQYTSRGMTVPGCANQVPNVGDFYDLAGDQLIPIDKAGRKYIIEGGWGFALAIEDGTTITKDGATVLGTINAGETMMFPIVLDPSDNDYDPGAHFIEGDKDFLLLHINRVDFEPGGAIIPPIECTGSQRVSFNRSSDQVNEQFFLKLLIKSGGEGDFTLTNDTYPGGNTTLISPTNFVDVPGTGGQWKYANIEFNNVDIPPFRTTTVENSSKLFHLGVVTGKPIVGSAPSTGSRYGYFSDFSEFDFDFPSVGDQCVVGDSLVLDADPGDTLDAGNTYTWVKVEQVGFSIVFDTLGNGETISVEESGSYFVVAENDLGCEAADTFSVSIVTIPNVNHAVLDTFMCNNTSIQLDYPLGTNAEFTNRQWVEASDTSVVLGDSVITVDQNGSYIFRVDNECGFDQDTVDVEFSTLTLDVGPDIILCEGDTGLTAATDGDPNYEYLWSTGETTQNITIDSVQGTDIYSVVVTDSLCSEEDSLAITFTKLDLHGVFPDDTTICTIDEPKNLNWVFDSSEVFDYVSFGWFLGETNRNDTLTFDTSIAAYHSVNGTYTYVFSASDRCQTLEDSIAITFAFPMVDLGPDQNPCEENLITLDPATGQGAGGYVYNWYSRDNPGTSLGSDSTYTFTQALDDTLVVHVRDGLCENRDTVGVAFTIIPQPDIDGDAVEVCPGDPVVIEITNSLSDFDGFTYEWRRNGSVIAGEQDASITATQDGNYVFAVMFPGCNEKTDDFDISDFTGTVDIVEDTSCTNSLLLNSNGGAGLTYVWYFNDAVINGEAGETYTATEEGEYKVEISSGACTQSDSTDVVFILIPDVPDLGSGVSCSGDEFVIAFPFDDISDLDGFEYRWISGGSTISTDTSITVTNNGTYTFEVSHPFGCAPSSGSFTLSQYILDVELGADQEPCEGTNPVLIPGPADSLDFIWSHNGDTLTVTDSSLTVDEDGTYAVYVEIGGCNRSDTVEIDFISIPEVELHRDTILCKGEQITVYSEAVVLDSMDWETYFWVHYDTTGALIDTIFSDTLTIVEEGDYELNVLNKCGQDTAQIMFRNWHVVIPNIFTPNDDQVNDEFIIEEITKGGVWHLEVYNRWGKRVFRDKDYKNNWDGVDINDQDLSSDGVYFFELSEEGECNYFKGWVTIVR